MDGVVDENTFGMAFSMSGLVDYVSVSCFQKVFTCVIPQFVAMDLLLYFNVCFRGLIAFACVLAHVSRSIDLILYIFYLH